ncbi:glycosyltransferase [Tabrizicola sp. M-4]|uniref:glycosyltransferase n=1 Tax=Tabrizicola sp. M-4 TaxID=3055847 RepID=UPI003DAA1298
MPSLLMVASAPVIVKGDRVILDVKFAEGMEAQTAAWDGPLDCILWEGATQIPFPVEVDRHSLPWGLSTLPAGAALPPGTGQTHDLIAAAGDMSETLDLAASGRTPVVYSVEYTHKTRLDILALDRGIGPLRRLRRRLWLERQEKRRRSAFRAAAALQSNGYPCAAAYAELNPDLHLYLDNRMTLDRYATAEEQDSRRARLQSGGPLRLVYSGRLDPMKGAQDLVPIAARLAARGIAFHLDIFGDGILRSEMASAIVANGLTDHVRLHGNVDFASELVPWQRRTADLFLSCHRQGDPSCTYIESMGCGLPIAGYGNEMWGPLCRASQGGWCVEVGDIDALAAKIAHTSRAEIAKSADSAITFARAHDFQAEFKGRMAHLMTVATRGSVDGARARTSGQ